MSREFEGPKQQVDAYLDIQLHLVADGYRAFAYINNYGEVFGEGDTIVKALTSLGYSLEAVGLEIIHD